MQLLKELDTYYFAVKPKLNMATIKQLLFGNLDATVVSSQMILNNIA